MAAVHVVARALPGWSVVIWPVQRSTSRLIAFTVELLASSVWIGLDGIRDGRLHGELDDQDDLTLP